MNKGLLIQVTVLMPLVVAVTIFSALGWWIPAGIEADLIRQAYETVDDGGSIFSIFRAWNTDAHKGGPVPQRKTGKLGRAHAQGSLKGP